jgi:hypothetical protein
MGLGFAAALLAAGTLAGATAAQAASYNLAADYSDSANPNGAWSYIYDGNALAHQTSPVANGNHLIPAVPAGGFFGAGNDLNQNTPFIFKAGVNGSSAGLTNSDFTAGDIVIHSPNDGTKNLTIVWKAPTAGTVSDLMSSAWYAHSTVARSNDVTLSLVGAVTTQLGAWTISSTEHQNRGNAATYTGGPFTVNAGDLITLSFLKTAGLPVGSDFGSLAGVAMSLNFAPVATPIPAALPLLMTGLAGLGWAGHRRRKQAA